jgi:hypothetical protein
MSFAFSAIPKEQIKLPGEQYIGMMTPYFMHLNIMNEQESEKEGRAVYEMIEAVQLRLPGDRHYSPVLRADEMWRKEGNRVITYMERFQDQYRAFLANEDQVAEGTPLENLVPYGITPAQQSICRALKIYSIESLYQLEGPNLKSLGMHANTLKPMAKRYMEDRRSGDAMARRVAELEAQLAGLKNGVVVPEEPRPEEVEAAFVEADNELIEAMTEDQLRDHIFKATGAKPDGRLGHATLVNMAKGL